MKNNIPKSLYVLIGAVLVSCSLFYFISPKDQIDGRFVMAVFSLIFAESFVWVLMTDQLSLDARQQGQVLPVRMGMGTVAAIIVLVAIGECWMYLSGADYSPMVVTLGVTVFFFMISTASLLWLTKKVAQDTTVADTQSSFMRTLRLRVGDLATKAQTEKGIVDTAVIKEFNILNDEIRYTTLQSFPGCDQINSELLNLVSTLESKFSAAGQIDAPSIIVSINQIRSALKRREAFIKQLQ